MYTSNTHSQSLNSPVRRIQASVELYEGSTLVDTYKYTDSLLSFSIDRVGEGKFFGFGIVQKANVKLIDIHREKEISTANTFKLYFGVNGEYINFFPTFRVTEVNRDEVTNKLSITMYDDLRKAALHTFDELELEAPYTIRDVAVACASLLGLSSVVANVSDGLFETYYETGANFVGTENLREVLDDIAEATQTIYFLNNENNLVFKRLDKEGAAVFTLGKARYYKLDSKTNRRLKKITHTTELGDNVHVEMAASGSTQFIRNNAFLSLRDDLQELLAPAMDSVINMTINQFECKWRGNYLLELGDKINLITKDGSVVTSYVLDDVIEYDGGLEQKTQWKYSDNEEETESAPITLGDAINLTTAKIDKANQTIELIVKDVDSTKSDISSLLMTTESIQATVQDLQGQVDMKMDSETFQVEIQKIIEDIDMSEITTKTGYTFNADGLKIEKTGTEMSTVITEDGMTVHRGGEAVLVANNEGVKAEDLHATTYLFIGKNSRLEDYDNGSRTGCFWIGEGGMEE